MTMMPHGGSTESAPVARPLRVLLALPRPLVELYGEHGESPVPLVNWDSTSGTHRPLPFQRTWDLDSVEGALQVSGAPMAVRVLYHPTLEDLGQVARTGYDVAIIDAHATDDGTFYLEGRYGESHLISATELGGVLGNGGVKVAILSACHSPTACRLLHSAGVPAVVAMTEAVREDAARVYLEVFLDQLARGYSLEEAGDQACAVLRQRWSTRFVEGELPHLVARKAVSLSRLVGPGVRGEYSRLEDSRSPEPRPPALSVRMRGRELDQVLVQRLLLPSVSGAVGRGSRQASSSLVTLCGFGGIGKSALALGVANWCWERSIFPDGVRVARLSVPRSDPPRPLADRLLLALGGTVSETGERHTPSRAEDTHRAKMDALVGVLRRTRGLLVVDGLQPAGATAGERDLEFISELRRGCPNLCLLFTSPIPLSLAGERLHRLEPLSVDAAVEIFRDQARDARKMLLHAERPIVADICELLDCIPLHIRLVASHIRAVRSPTAILEQLREIEARCSGEGEGSPSRSPYELSRRLAFQYAYDHLGEHGRRLWAVMAGVFAGAPGRADVRAVYAHFNADQALDGLLLWSVVTSVSGRHHMAHCLREFGRQQLAAGVLDEEETAFRERHAAHYLAYAQEHQRDLEALERERYDILAAFQYTSGSGRDTRMTSEYAQVLGGLGWL
jgi:predicted ATPase